MLSSLKKIKSQAKMRRQSYTIHCTAQESQPQYEHNFTAPPVAQQVVQQIIGAAYVDPNDPTKLYVSQPVAQPNIPVATAVPMQ